MKDKSKQLIMSIAAALLLVLLTIGVTYAIFTSIQMGSTENTVTAGTLKFLYTENTGVGAGVALTEALPVSDTIGKAYSTEGKVFDFSVSATNTGTEVIPYEITLRKKSTSTLPDNGVKVYLTDMTEDADSELLEPSLYSVLPQTNIDVGDEVEKTIYTDSVTGNTTDYLKNFRLRMWVADTVNIGDDEYSGKTFTATVNVYSNESVVSGTGYVSIFGKNFKVIQDTPNLTTASTTCTTTTNSSNVTTTSCNEHDEAGLYKSTNTNTGNPTYYFRGNVTNNYVSFAGQTWKMVRINEDGTIRLVMQDIITPTSYDYNSTGTDYTYTYYTNSNAKTELNTWYANNIESSTDYSNKVATGNYFCEQARVTHSSDVATLGNETLTLYSSYTPNFKCETDANGYGLVNSNIGLLTYDEVIYAGGYFNIANTNYYLSSDYSFWLMSPNGFGTYPLMWMVNGDTLLNLPVNVASANFRPVINLKANVTATGSGTSTDMFIIQ